jgi:hypothetical protein
VDGTSICDADENYSKENFEALKKEIESLKYSRVDSINNLLEEMSFLSKELDKSKANEASLTVRLEAAESSLARSMTMINSKSNANSPFSPFKKINS